MSDLPELKPCPFCGGHARPMKCQDGIDGTMGCNKWVTITCSMCEINNGGKGGFMRPRYDTSEEAAKAWNTRADLNEALKAENEKLREALKRIAWLPSNHGTTFKKLIRCQEIAHEALDETISKCGGEK